MRPQAHDIAVPPFPPGTEWVGPEPGAVERICARGPLLVHFVDAAHLSSVRTLPYVGAWEERYRDLGLTVVGVNSPRFPFTADAGKLAAALDAARGRLPRRRRLRLPDLARLRMRGVAVAVPLGPGRGAALVPLRRGRVRGHRGGDPGGAAGPRPGPRAARAPARPSAQRRPGRARRAAQRRGLPGRLGVRAVASARRRPAARARLRGGRRLGDGRRARRAARLARRRAASSRSRSRRRAPTSWPPTSATRAHHLSLGATPGMRVYSIASRRECPELTARSEVGGISSGQRARPGSPSGA